MSILYDFIVREAERITFPVYKIIDYCYDAMNDNFRRDLKSFGIDLTGEPKKIKSERFVELMRAYAKDNEIKDYKVFIEKMRHYEEQGFEDLRQSVKNNEITGEGFSYGMLMWNNLLSEITGKEENVVDVLRLNLEVASIHPGAGFPKYQLNAATTKNNERRFLIRLLSSIYNGHDYSKNPIENWYNERGKNTNYDAGYYSNKTLWGFSREKKSIKIKPESQAFWKKHKDKWWAYLENSLTQDSDYKPYEVVTYDVIIHPSWFDDLDEIYGGIYESAAHWMR